MTGLADDDHHAVRSHNTYPLIASMHLIAREVNGVTLCEFSELAFVTENSIQKSIDVHAAGDKQSEAVFCCLYEMKKALKKGTLTQTKPWVVYYDWGTDLQWETLTLLKDLLSSGVRVDVRSQ
jgi:hypothetical protein